MAAVCTLPCQTGERISCRRSTDMQGGVGAQQRFGSSPSPEASSWHGSHLALATGRAGCC